jgi:hypothetical protein
MASARDHGNRNAALKLTMSPRELRHGLKDILRSPTPARSRHGLALARRPSRLVNTQGWRAARRPHRLIARRFRGALYRDVGTRVCGRRAASASARGPWPCSLSRSCWADESNVWAKAPINQRYFGTTMSRTFLALAASGEHAQHTRRSATVLRRDETLYVLCGNHKP